MNVQYVFEDLRGLAHYMDSEGKALRERLRHINTKSHKYIELSAKAFVYEQVAEMLYRTRLGSGDIEPDVDANDEA